MGNSAARTYYLSDTHCVTDVSRQFLKQYRRRTNWLPVRRIALTVSATLFAASACSTLPISATDDVCRVFHRKPTWHHAARNMQDKWRVPLNVAMSVMYHESKFRRKAKPPRRYIFGVIPWKRRSSAYGYAQAIDSTWETYVQQSRNYGARRTNFYDSMDFVGWYIVKSESLAGIAKDDAYNHYLAYHEGWTGYRNQSYNKKQWLKQVATEVANTAGAYEQQYRQCGPRLMQALNKPVTPYLNNS